MSDHPAASLEDGTPSDSAVRQCLRLLAQRGARLVAAGRGVTVEARRHGAMQAVAWLERPVFEALLHAGWIDDTGSDGFALSADGRRIARLIKAAPSPSDAARQPSAASPPAQMSRPRADPDSPLGWLRARKDKAGAPYVSDEAAAAAERLQADFHRAGMMPRVTVDWEAVPRSRDELRGRAAAMRDTGGGAAAAEARVRRALDSVPPELARLLLDICCLGRRFQETERSYAMPPRSVHYLLAIALNALARHYGLLPPPAASWPASSGIRHWGTQDYRPTVDGDML